MFATRSYEAELMDDLNLSSDDLKKNLEELEIINHWLGGHQVVLNALTRLLRSGLTQSQRPLRIADLGSGGGDLLRVIAKWLRKRGIQAELIGLDANDFMIQYAQERSQAFPEIQFVQLDIFSEDFQANHYDLVVASLFCHHFSDEALVQLFEKLYLQAKKAVIINDLHRHWLAYYSIRFLTRVARGSYLVQHDAPLSVRRAFKRAELAKMLQAAGIQKFEIRWLWAFRYQVIFPTRSNLPVDKIGN